MKTVILAGGRGTRLMDETHGEIPKPMLRVGGIPMLEHIMRIYIAHGFGDFVVATGYLGHVIHRWSMRFSERVERYGRTDISLQAIHTGNDSQTGGRLRWLAEAGVLDYEPFMMTYGDGMADVNLKALLQFHHEKSNEGALVTLTAVHPPSRFGKLDISNGWATSFGEKTGRQIEGWINAGFYVIEPEAVELVNGESCRWEYDVLPILALQGRLAVYQHPGFFQMCDTWRELQLLNEIHDSGAPWLRMENHENSN